MKRVMILAVMLMPTLAMAELYKWIDANGRVHFTDKKPTSAAKVETLNTPRAQAPSGTVADAPPPAQSDDPVARQKKMADILSQERERNEAEADKKRKEVAARRKRCLELQDYRRTADGSRLYDINDKGDRVYMDDKAHVAHLRELDDNIARYCR